MIIFNIAPPAQKVHTIKARQLSICLSCGTLYAKMAGSLPPVFVRLINKLSAPQQPYSHQASQGNGPSRLKARNSALNAVLQIF